MIAATRRDLNFSLEVKVDRQVLKIGIGHFALTFRHFLSVTMLKGIFLDWIEFESGLLLLVPGKSRMSGER